MDITYSFMIPVLEAIAKACHSYGWAIVLLTLLVRVAVYPLTKSSTLSMQRMSKMQPQMKVIQERYKDQPEILQKKLMEFYKRNQVNPLGGCLPTLVQLPILIALFSAFSGPPFGDKAISERVVVVSKGQAQNLQPAQASSGTSPYVTADGKLAKLVIFPGETTNTPMDHHLTVEAGQSMNFGVRAIEGLLPADFEPTWKIMGDSHGATIDHTGHAVFPNQGTVTVQAVIPGIAKSESFGFIRSLGKVATGMNLLKPDNWDNLAMIIFFGVSMFISSKLMVQPAAAGADSEQQMIQKQTQTVMPFTVTAMFFFFPLPSGVFLYMVISNIMQSAQTWWIMRSPVPEMVDIDAPTNGASDVAAVASTKVAAAKPKERAANSSSPASTSKPNPQRKKSRKKK